jgi:anhydro-N-acetylmuramic acid kinase
MPLLFLGLISGTSADGIDVALVRFEPELELIAGQTFPYPGAIRERAIALMHAPVVSLEDLGSLDVEIGEAFAQAALALLAQAGVAPSQISALGSHGQTVRHRPWLAHPFTLQIGDPNRIAERTGIRTVADFRRRDVAAGGQGAPLVCALHAALFASPDEARAVLNLGGIGNLTLLEPGRPVRGFDTGPANCLMDAWATQHLGSARDEGGDFARSGRALPALLTRLLDDDYFAKPIPKSTGREHFHAAWLRERLSSFGDAAPADVQATLIELSARSIAQALGREAPAVHRVIACGGGVHNAMLMQALEVALQDAVDPACVLERSDAHGLDPDFVEATAFAWLARATLAGAAGNCAEVTGAAGPRVLGAVYAGA